jgi:pyruvate dehydrogenase (quinone)/pyruvate oxidase
MVFLGNPEYGVELQPIDFAKIAEGFGLTGIHIEDPKRCEEQVVEALNHAGPVLIEAQVDPFEPPMPPKVTREQAMHFAQALMRGEPNREKIALTAIKDKVRELI